MSISNIFSFKYRCSFDVDICKERLTEDYRRKMVANREKLFSGKLGWNIYFYEFKGEKITIEVSGFRRDLNFKTQLLRIQNETLITGKTNPFTSITMWFILLGALFGLVGIACGCIGLLMGIVSDNTIGLICLGLPIFAGFGMLWIMSICTARNAVIEYLVKALNAKPLIENKGQRQIMKCMKCGIKLNAVDICPQCGPVVYAPPQPEHAQNAPGESS